MSARRIAPGRNGELPPALVASPRPPDSAVLRRALNECGIPADVMEGTAPLAGGVDDIGCLVVTQEVLTTDFRDIVGQALDAQPSWSELPIVAVLENRDPGVAWRDVLLERWVRANITFLIRPVSGLEFESAVQLAISTRMRQFRIRDQLQQEQELRRELNHRVKNIFATVQAIASMTRRTAEGQDPFDKFSERLVALGRVHDTLDRIGNEGETFASLTRAVLAPYLETEERFAITGPDAPLDPSACNMLGLCLFELATNATKHGALSVNGGTVAIDLSEKGGIARFSWIEHGGPPVSEPTRKGYGTRFLTMTLASIFEASPIFEYAPAGFRLTTEGRPYDLFAKRVST